MTEPTHTVSIDDVHKTYRAGGDPVHALDGVTLGVPHGQFVVVRGKSGSGKTTLLQLLAGLRKPTRGRIRIADVDVAALDANEVARFRRQQLGIVYQFFNLVPSLGIEQNIALPLLLDGRYLSDVLPQVHGIMQRLQIDHRRRHQTSELSGGEMQRVAIARALVAEPALVLADEPTGNLDSGTGRHVLRIFRELSRERGVSFIMMTHDEEASSYADRIVVLEDGRVCSDTARCG